MSTRRDFVREATRSAAKSLFSFAGLFGGLLRDTASALQDAGPGTQPRSKELPQPWLRPPGALPEEAFLKACTRCDACVKVCPHDAIRKATHAYGASVQGTPIIMPALKACRLCKELPCIAICEPEALQAVTRSAVRMGLARIDEETCYAFNGQPCDYCVTKCPLKREAIGFNKAGRPQISETGCSGCGVCVELCPTNAIGIYARPEPHCVPSQATHMYALGACQLEAGKPTCARGQNRE